METKAPSRTGYVPAAPIAERVAEWISNHVEDKDPEKMGPIEYLAQRLDTDRSWIEKLARGEYERIAFDKADRLMCAMHAVHEWIHHQTYQEFDLKKLDALRPIHTRRRGGGRKRKVSYTKIAYLFQAGMSREDIRKETGATRHQVERALAVEGLRRNQLGLTGRQRSFNYAEAKRIHDEENLTWVQVADRLDVNVKVLYQAMRRVRQGVQILGTEEAA